MAGWEVLPGFVIISTFMTIAGYQQKFLHKWMSGEPRRLGVSDWERQLLVRDARNKGKDPTSALMQAL
eukprot:CAMPEP_0177659238 /NCGR_PEP_ID=MMETSP0447-20121125/17332_1 /TAXON_ID=0 /ORGANISM="Stygamoeba regulata, Strain BSH-02190019" /LENGTH=67 /DNA_ID=CAMNT_0019164087 /DNA_START=29 /DNA_END=232 /DNA_ORIENTATION=-